MIHADIDGDGYPDYALLLRSDKSQAARFVVLLCSGEKPCKKVYGLDWSGYSDCAYLTADPPADMSETRTAVAGGQSPTQPTEQAAELKPETTGILVTYFGKGQILLHWSKKAKKLLEVQTMD